MCGLPPGSMSSYRSDLGIGAPLAQDSQMPLRLRVIAACAASDAISQT